MASGLAEKRKGKGNAGVKDRSVSPTAGIKPYKLNQGYRYLYDDFKGPILCAKDLGAGACTGTAGDINKLYTGDNTLEWRVIGTQTIVAPALGAAGLDITQDNTTTDGAEYSFGITAQSPLAFVTGTDAFYLKLKFSCADTSGLNEMAVGFRKAEAFTGTFDDYNDLACINTQGSGTSAKHNIETITGGAATVTTDTTQTMADAATVTIGVYVNKGGNAVYTINGAAPTVTAAYQFTSALTVVPFIYNIGNSDTQGALQLIEFECGLMEANVR